MIEKSYKNKMKKRANIEQKPSPSDDFIVKTQGSAKSNSSQGSAPTTSTPRGSIVPSTTKSQPVTHKEETDASDVETLKADELYFWFLKPIIIRISVKHE